MDVMGVSFPPSVIFSDINGKSREILQKVIVLVAELNLRALLLGMDTWHMINASRGERQKPADRMASAFSVLRTFKPFPACGTVLRGIPPVARLNVRACGNILPGLRTCQNSFERICMNMEFCLEARHICAAIWKHIYYTHIMRTL
jgi:hypothetical protein